MVSVYLVRHGTPNKEDVDPQKSLSEYGENEVASVARMLQSKIILRVGKIHHSTKLRARQTAEILGKHLDCTIEEKQGLLPTDDPCVIAEELENEKKDLMIVGHLPFLSKLASLLLCQNQELEIVRFEPATVAEITKAQNDNGKEQTPSPWTITHVVSPDIASQN